MSDETLDFVLERMAAQREHRRPRCWGISSDALTLFALGKGPRPQTPGRSDGLGSWSGKEMGTDYPHDEDDLRACELTYAMAPAHLQVIMLPVLTEFQAWVREGKNCYGEKVREPRTGSGVTGMTFRTSEGEVHI